MMTDVEKNFYQLLEKLPKDLQNAISGVDTADAIESIAKKYSLLIDKMGILAEETGLVMLGITHPKDFISNLSQKLGVDRETARKFAENTRNQRRSSEHFVCFSCFAGIQTSSSLARRSLGEGGAVSFPTAKKGNSQRRNTSTVNP